MPSPRIAVLGPVLVAGTDGALQPVPGALARSFLTALVLARGHALSTEALIDELWADEPPRGARAALQTLVSRLRRSTSSGLVVSTGSGYALAVTEGDVDLVAAEHLAAVERPVGADPDVLRAGLGLWRGDPGGDVDGDLGAALADRAALAAKTLRRALGTALLDHGDADAAVALWHEECTADPFDEVAVGGVMRALGAAGRVGEALAVFAAHRDRLVDELGADPSGDLVRLNAELLRRSAATTGTARRIGLRSAPTAMIGREDDLGTVSRLLADHRLVTVLGAGGLGKTRLAQAVAAGVPDERAVVFLELAPITTGEDVVPALAALLGVAEMRAGRTLRTAVVADLRTRVVAALDEQPTVLVLDNCEHIVTPVASLAADLLARVPDLRILTTSRAPLAVAGEVVAPLAPLPVAADGAAVRLFTERARAARPGAVLPVDAVRRICTRLDGSPLAIELAAARIRGMALDEIERRLDDRFALLRGGDRSAPERHRTLLAVIEWSWRLLDTSAQDLLTRLALLPDGLSVDAVEAVVAGDRRDDALDDLAELVEQSLVQLVEHDGDPVRYRLLETVREFGAARLADRDGTAEVRRAMLRWGTDFGRDRNLFVVAGEDQLRAFADVRRESDNLVTLLRWAMQDDDRPAATQVFAVLASYWSLRGAHGEVVAIAADVIAVLRSAPPRPEDRTAFVLALVVAGASALFADRRTGARAISTLRREMRAGTTGDRVVDAEAQLLLLFGRRDEGEALLARYRDDADPRLACLALTISAPLAENGGDVETALGYVRRAERLASSIDDPWTTSTAAMTMTQLLGQSGRPEEALRSADLARTRLERFDADDDLWELQSTIALAAAAAGDVVRARALADDIGGRRENFRGFDGDRAQMAVLAVVIRAEAARAEGDAAAAAAAYAAAWDLSVGFRRDAQQWTLMVGAARMAADLEAVAGTAGPTGPDVAGPDAPVPDPAVSAGVDPGLPAGRADQTAVSHGSWPEIARRIRVTALVWIRTGFWLDMPVLGTAAAGIALRAAVDGVDPALVARAWGVAMRLGARQDFAVLGHDRLRARIARHVDERLLDDAATASARWSRDEAVARARELFEERALR